MKRREDKRIQIKRLDLRACCILLLQIIEVLDTLETYSVLSESKIEGIETISNRFQSMYSALKKKPYDPLDHRKPDFEADFTEFKRQISDFEVCETLSFLI